MRAFVASELPGSDGGCGWIELLEPPPPARRLEGRQRADVAVLGAGFTGLAAARRLAEVAPGRRVAVVEARRAGDGASGRCSGFVVDRAHFIARMEPPAADRFVHLSRRGIASLARAVAEAGIDCGWDERGWIHAAAGAAGERCLSELTGWLDGRGERYLPLDSGELAAVTGTPYYRAGVRLPGSVLVQPAALVRGLAASLPSGVELFEESPVVAIEPGSPIRLRTSCGGELAADRLLVAVNGAAHALGLLRRRIFPLWTFASLTRPLTPSEAAALGGEPAWGLLAQDPLGATLRRTGDGRLLIRDSVVYERALAAAEAARERARGEHRRALAARFPELAELPFEHTWGGAMGMSRNGACWFGPVARGVWAAGGYNAAGIALGTVCGELLAELAMGLESDDLDALRTLPGPAWLPPDPLLGFGVRWRVRAMARQAASPR